MFYIWTVKITITIFFDSVSSAFFAQLSLNRLIVVGAQKRLALLGAGRSVSIVRRRTVRMTDELPTRRLNCRVFGANGTQAGSLCYINAVASSLQVHGDSSRDGSGGSLDSPEGQCSIGFQPVFCSHVERCSTLLARLNCAL
jgi:hypothetical protein